MSDELARGGIIENQLREMGLVHANLAGAPPIEMRISWEAPEVPLVLAVTIFSTAEDGRRIALPDDENRAMKEVRLFLIEPDWTLRPIEYARTSREVLEDGA